MTDLTTLSDRALKILLIIWQAATAVSNDYIRARYGRPLSENSLKIALLELSDPTRQLIARSAYRGNCWIATPNTRQLILGESPTDNLSDSLQTSPREVSIAPLKEEEEEQFRSSKTREIPLLPPQEPRETSPREVSRPQVIHSSGQVIHNLTTEALLTALDEAGIVDPARAQLATLPHVTETLVRYHADTAPNLILAIYRIRMNWRIPKAALAKYDPDNARYLKYVG